MEHLKYDVTNLAHYLRQDAEVLVVGVGGGRDVLTALVFDQKSVVGVEMNGAILEALTKEFGEFTGHLDQDPRVTLVNDEARSYISRQRDHYDILMISLIDTWAATAAGAYVLAENSLYTVEAWETFLGRLKDDGILTVSRWFYRKSPGEVYRTTSLATASLQRLGIEEPRKHMMLIASTSRSRAKKTPNDIGTILVSRKPFSAKDVQTIEEVSARMGFEVILSPDKSMDETLAELASGKDLEGFTASYPIDISPSTDDKPFFFNMLRLNDVLKTKLWAQGIMSFNMVAVATLGMLMAIVVGLTALCIIVPLVLTTERKTLRGSLPLFLFFAGIGLGFMLVEISQMQRLIVFLGHPVYGLSVVLFGLLLSSGLGSFTTNRIDTPRAGGCFFWALVFLGVVAAFGGLTPKAIAAFAHASMALRITVAVGILFPLGFVMGMAFPMGMKLAAGHSPKLTPWLWGINGATSVCASVFAVAIAMTYGISRAFWIGVGCYAVAWLMLTLQAALRRNTPVEPALASDDDGVVSPALASPDVPANL
jgi:hypothetical protein